MSNAHLQRKSGFVLLSELDGRGATGYVTLVHKNGLIQVVPRPKRRSVSTVPLKLVVLFAILITVFKALALLNVGVVDYEADLATLSEGNVFEKAGAFALQIDPVTQVIFETIGPLLK
ncbi:hypothetical protein [Planktotalea sp.]|uniref:hypothetical protein n=1 Tax=Planktotalea sp. TaxID=2029877 RepID=UPI0025F4B69D|nr:hypothetical protein [Planktotalea sp.]